MIQTKMTIIEKNLEQIPVLQNKIKKQERDIIQLTESN